MIIIEEKIAIKELFDKFSIFADQKNSFAQTELCTEDAILKAYQGDVLKATYSGRSQIEVACQNLYDINDTIYHLNGQQILEFTDDNNANGMAYCIVVTIGKNENGKLMQTMQGVRNEDIYKRVNGIWMIASRSAHFEWSDVKEVK